MALKCSKTILHFYTTLMPGNKFDSSNGGQLQFFSKNELLSISTLPQLTVTSLKEIVDYGVQITKGLSGRIEIIPLLHHH